VLARAEAQSPGERSGVTMFIVPTDAPGLEIIEIPKLGLHTAPSCTVYLDRVAISDDALLGKVGGAWSHVLKGLSRERMAISAMCTGMSQAALDYALLFARDRQQFGVPIVTFQAVQHLLADMITEVEGARSMMLYAASLEAIGQGSARIASMAKVRSTEAVVRTARLGMQVLGGAWYTMEYPMQRYMRDSLIHPIAGGTNEIQKNIISSELLKQRAGA
jgi:alkylation response protein AidB-like acyl-CoA dehydrogenase